MNNEIKVSVTCITFNQVDYIEETIKSFLMQKTNFKFEILIHDDASIDGTDKVILKYAELYPDIVKPLIQIENQYSKGNRRVDYINHQRAMGKYITQCEGDDLWGDENKLQKQFDYMEKNPECNLTFSNVKYLDGYTNKIVGETNIECKKYTIEDVIKNGGEFIPTASIMYRKIEFDNPPKFYFEASVGDYPFQMIVAKNGYIYCFKECMATYRVNAKNSWSRTGNDLVFDIEKNINNNNSMIKILDSFNKFSNGEFSNIIENTKIPFEFNIYTIKNNSSIKAIKNSKFKEHYKNIMNNCSTNKKIDTYFLITSTDRYFKFLKIKRTIKKLLKKG